MAAVRFQKGSEEWMMFGDLYKLMQDYWEPEETDEYWLSLSASVRDFHDKYQTEIARELALAVMNGIEREWKTRTRSKGESNE